MSVNKINQASSKGVKSHLARNDASHTTVKAPSITQSANNTRKGSTGLSETNSKDSLSSQVNKKVSNIKSSFSRSNMKNFSSSRVAYDDRPVGGAINVSAVFGGKPEETSTLPAVIIKQARQSGQLNLSNRNLSQIPDKVWRINDLDEEEQKSLKKGLSIDRVCELQYIPDRDQTGIPTSLPDIV